MRRPQTTALARSTPTRVGKTVHGCTALSAGTRSTPTRVGKTPSIGNCIALTHRSTPTRVGKTSAMSLASDVCGPPPRVWGKLTSHRHGPPPRVWGITVHPRAFTVHPHACGETADRCANAVHPHACGENARRQPDIRLRSTPTRVGKTRALAPAPHCRTPIPVHPHACGENHRDRRYLMLERYGPPPRVWGKLLRSLRSQHRSTPTRVGNQPISSRLCAAGHSDKLQPFEVDDLAPGVAERPHLKRCSLLVDQI